MCLSVINCNGFCFTDNFCRKMSSASAISVSNLSFTLQNKWRINEIRCNNNASRIQGIYEFKGIAQTDMASLNLRQRRFLLNLFKSNINNNDQYPVIASLCGLGNMAYANNFNDLCDPRELFRDVFNLVTSNIEAIRSHSFWCISALLDNNWINAGEGQILVNCILNERQVTNGQLKGHIINTIAGNTIFINCFKTIFKWISIHICDIRVLFNGKHVIIHYVRCYHLLYVPNHISYMHRISKM